MDEFVWRPMCGNDLDGVVEVAAAAFPDHFEERACFAERLALFPQGCFVLAAGEAVKGHLIAYPWPLGAIPPLNSLLHRLPDTQDALYLHDLALHPDMRGRDHARWVVEQLFQDAPSLGVRAIALVSVNDTAAFWQNLGFVPVAGDAAIAGKLQSYGHDAVYMAREL